MAYSGTYKVKNLKKYAGDPTKVTYRSLWERRCMVHFDDNENILEWSSEEVIIPYISKLDGKRHRYFVDFKVKFRDKNTGIIKTALIEVKPLKQLSEPKPKKKPTKRYIAEVATWIVNNSKWEYAEAYCAARGWLFWKWTLETIDDVTGVQTTKRPHK